MKNIYWLGGILLVCQSTWADQTNQTTAEITVNVTINAVSCHINNNKPIDVDFGSEVAVTDVAAGLVAKEISYSLECDNADATQSLRMNIKGTGADFDAAVLKTSITNLGVKIQANGADYPLNTALNFVGANNKPALKAVLVQKPGARLQTGAFTAGATMTVDYQ